jgi:hypothetical protein
VSGSCPSEVATSGRDGRRGFLGLFLGGREDLQDFATLRHLELVLALVVFLFQLFLGDVAG